jgi:hypothetical protein
MNKNLILLCAAVLSSASQVAVAQDNKKFLDDYFLGSVTEQTLIVRDIDELVIARETGRQAALLSHCKNYKTLDSRTEFDSYSEELRKLLAKRNRTINALNGFNTLASAAALNEFSDDDITLLKALIAKREYADMMSYLWFENVMRQLTEGLIDVNTGIKQPWIAARALSYLKDHKLYTSFLTTLTPVERELLNQEVLASLQPASVSKETQYTESLSQLFAKQLESKALLHALPIQTAAYIVQLQDVINPENKRALGALRLLSDIPTNLACKSSDKRNCVNNEWFEEAKSAFNKEQMDRLPIAKKLLNDKYQNLCNKSLALSSPS